MCSWGATSPAEEVVQPGQLAEAGNDNSDTRHTNTQADKALQGNEHQHCWEPAQEGWHNSG
jgi:hypothetical protein